MVFSNLELTEDDIRYSQPDKIITKLKPHQLSSLYKSIMMENTGEITYKIKEFHNYSQLFFDNLNIINPDSLSLKSMYACGPSIGLIVFSSNLLGIPASIKAK